MARALPRISPAFVLLVALVPAGGAFAGPKAGEGRASNSFILLTSAPPPAAARPRSNGVGVPPAQPVVRNPYQVPLLSNAGTFGSVR